MKETNIYNDVQKHYGTVAQSRDGEYAHRVAKSFGYSEEELKGSPQDANLGMSCGNPHALANLKEGETVIDLGSGAGFDIFLAAPKVGEHGKAIGVDMNPDMLKRANQIKESKNAANVSFVHSQIDDINLPDQIADCVISNCVINLVPESHKPKVFTEIYRLLRPGGRVAVSDILAKGELPHHVKSDIALYVGCIAGASQVSEYERYLQEAGFKDVLIVDTHSDLNVYREAGNTDCCGPTSSCKPAKSTSTASATTNGQSNGTSKCGPSTKAPAEDLDFNSVAGSFKIFAVK